LIKKIPARLEQTILLAHNAIFSEHVTPMGNIIAIAKAFREGVRPKWPILLWLNCGSRQNWLRPMSRPEPYDY
jgi:hypothetical protein